MFSVPEPGIVVAIRLSTEGRRVLEKYGIDSWYGIHLQPEMQSLDVVRQWMESVAARVPAARTTTYDYATADEALAEELRDSSERGLLSSRETSL